MRRLSLLFAVMVINILSVIAQTRYTKTDINLRYGPGTNYNIVTILPKGTAVTIAEDCDCKWIPVSYNGYIGYIRSSYLSRNKVSRVSS